MIILDTNVISELMRTTPAERVIDWLDQQEPSQLYTTTISLAEIHYGLQSLPKGHRRTRLEESFKQAINTAFSQRVLPFDKAAAETYGDMMAHRKKMRRPLSLCDGQIAAITRSCGYQIATRNTKDFEHCSIDCINPF